MKTLLTILVLLALASALPGCQRNAERGMAHTERAALAEVDNLETSEEPPLVFNGGPQPGTNLIACEAGWDAETQKIKVIWPSESNSLYLVWWSERGGILYPVDYRDDVVIEGTNAFQRRTYPPVSACWGTNQTHIFLDWPSNVAVVFAVSKLPPT